VRGAGSEQRRLAQAFVGEFFVFDAGDFYALRVSIPRGGCVLRSRRGPEIRFR
jgi:hypothetical protein